MRFTMVVFPALSKPLKVHVNSTQQRGNLDLQHENAKLAFFETRLSHDREQTHHNEKRSQSTELVRAKATLLEWN